MPRKLLISLTVLTSVALFEASAAQALGFGGDERTDETCVTRCSPTFTCSPGERQSGTALSDPSCPSLEPYRLECCQPAISGARAPLRAPAAFCTAYAQGCGNGGTRDSAAMAATSAWEYRVGVACRGRQHAGRWDCARNRRSSCSLLDGGRYWRCCFSGRTVELC